MADKKITQLDALTAFAAEDLLPVVDDPAGTPVTKKIAVGDFLGQWIADTLTWTYASPTTITIAGDVTARFPPGTRIRYTQTTVKYGVVVGSSYSAPSTTLAITGGTSYVLANAAIGSPAYSYVSAPPGYPGWFNYISTMSGSGGSIGTYAEDLTFGIFSVVGRTVFFQQRKRITNKGSWSGDVQMSVPVARASSSSDIAFGFISSSAGGFGGMKGWAMIQGGSYFRFYKTDGTNLQWSDLAANDSVYANLTYDF